MNNVQDWLSGFFEMNPDAIEHTEEKLKKKESTLALSVELDAMDFCKKDFYKNLSIEHKKEISLYVLMRFMSSSKNHTEHHLMMVNNIVNVHFSDLNKHPELQWKLLALCGTNRKQFHEWIAPGKKGKKNKIEEALESHFPLLDTAELELLISKNTVEELTAFFIENGYDDKTIKDIFKDTPKGK